MLSLSARHIMSALQVLTASIVNKLSPVSCAADPLLKNKSRHGENSQLGVVPAREFSRKPSSV